ncbi:MAG: hypothetical protein ACREVQ_00140 [Burkholderiales bacterium]
MSQQINLFNPLFMRQEKYFSARTMAQSLGIIVLGMLLLYAYALVQTRSLGRTASDYQGQLASQRAQYIELGSQGRSRLLDAEVARLEGEVASRQSVLTALEGGELGTTEGVSRFFAAFARHTMRGVWLTRFSVGEGGNALRVQGRVLYPDLIPAYLKLLNDDDVMRGRLVTELKLVARSEAVTREPQNPAGPSQFVEFDFSAPLRLAPIGKR